jgi:hypothetical protein
MLNIGIHGNEFNALYLAVHHPCYGVTTTSTNANDFDFYPAG